MSDDTHHIDCVVGAITTNNAQQFYTHLQCVQNINTATIYSGMAVDTAIFTCKYDFALALIERGADVNHGDRILIRRVSRPEQRLFLLRHGSHVPRVYTVYYPEVKEYVNRLWAPENHFDWPTPFKKQILFLLLAIRRCGRRWPAHLLQRFFEFVAANHFVFT